MRRFGPPLVLLAVVAGSQSAARDLTLIKAGALVDVDRGIVRRNQLILVRGDRIERVLSAGAAIPGWPGCWICPMPPCCRG